VKAVCLVRPLVPCSSATSLAIVTPFAFTQGPLPMRSRALTAPAPCVERYARHVLAPAPADAASRWQSWSAPARPPRSAPLPSPALVTKKDIVACCASAGAAHRHTRHAASGAPSRTNIIFTSRHWRRPAASPSGVNNPGTEILFRYSREVELRNSAGFSGILRVGYRLEPGYM